jgi:hypothetical protein
VIRWYDLIRIQGDPTRSYIDPSTLTVYSRRQYKQLLRGNITNEAYARINAEARRLARQPEPLPMRRYKAALRKYPKLSKGEARKRLGDVKHQAAIRRKLKRTRDYYERAQLYNELGIKIRPKQQGDQGSPIVRRTRR